MSFCEVLGTLGPAYSEVLECSEALLLARCGEYTPIVMLGVLVGKDACSCQGVEKVADN